MSVEEPHLARVSCRIIFTFFLILVAGRAIAGNSIQTDEEVLIQLKSFLEQHNRINQGKYADWGQSGLPLCDWPGLSCSNGRVASVNLSDSNIAGPFFRNFSGLTLLTALDLSKNAIKGELPPDLNQCKNLRYLNLSHNILEGELNLTGLNQLENLDLTLNRFSGGIQTNFPAICSKLISLNLSTNNFTGEIANSFYSCGSLQYVDLSSNKFVGPIWAGFARLREFSVSENNLTGEISREIFASACNLEMLDLSENLFAGQFPQEISNCKALDSLNLYGNGFVGLIPSEIGALKNLRALYLGSNNFSREIPETLLNCSELIFLDVSYNNFQGEIQPIFGKFVQLKFLLLHANWYSGGLNSSRILQLPQLVRLDLSYNNFSRKLPIEISNMKNLVFLMLAYNQFYGEIPHEYGNLSLLQALDLSSNRLTGRIPPTIGKLKSLLWLMLANNTLNGEIPREIGNCSSLLWLNLANNQLSGDIPSEISAVGSNPEPTFESNRRLGKIMAASGECLSMKRWIPETYPPFSFSYKLLNRNSCRSIWDRLLKGYGIFSICQNSSDVRQFVISGYIQLTGNELTGGIPPEIGNMRNLSLLHLGKNALSGSLSPELKNLPLVSLNVSWNRFSGEIPEELGDLRCLQNLDLSHNNFSGEFPISLNQLNELSKFNVSENPLVTGRIPSSGQLATFEYDSFLGDPLIVLVNQESPSGRHSPSTVESNGKRPRRFVVFMICLALSIAFVLCGAVSFIVCTVSKNHDKSIGFLLDTKRRHDLESSSCSSSTCTQDAVKIFKLGKAAFSYEDIVTATGDFSDDAVVGVGGSGQVYKGILPDGRAVAVKKIQREGPEGEREFRAEMEVLSGNGIGWPQPNLVTLFGWCLYGSEKLLIYEYMEGGSLEDLVPDRQRLGWRRRVEVAIGVARALVFLHHECSPPVVHRDVKASNVLLDGEGRARVTDFGLARVVRPGESHVSTMIAGTVGYVAPEYGHTWRATTKGDVYSFGVLAMELGTGRRAVDGTDECLVDWVRRVASGAHQGLRGAVVPVMMSRMGVKEGEEEAGEGLGAMCELVRIGIRCTAESPQARPDMKEVLGMLLRRCGSKYEA
ncbi:probable LRR receptor-like serine/threonine-protein kinase At1g74360 [Aristolochia californica]|uniref:probable LRR receptor-like serine/threonine-protein kinase At1g74360 n=1 Tax=Aristolochia californica TaxID=171875 RepID=UPI0035DC10BB